MTRTMEGTSVFPYDSKASLEGLASRVAADLGGDPHVVVLSVTVEPIHRQAYGDTDATPMPTQLRCGWWAGWHGG